MWATIRIANTTPIRAMIASAWRHQACRGSLARQLRQLHSQPIPLRRQLVALEDELVALGAQLRLAPRLLLQAGQELLALHRPLLALCQQAIALDGGPVPL